MHLHISTRPNFRSHYPKTGKFPDWHVFKNSFILNKQRIGRFITFHSQQGFDGKFVFNKKTRKLVLAPGEDDSQHSAIAYSTDTAYKREDIIAAYITFSKEGNKCVFELDEESSSFDEPPGYRRCQRNKTATHADTYQNYIE